MKRLTRAILKKHDACKDGREWYESHKGHTKDLSNLLDLAIKEDQLHYMEWVAMKLLTKTEMIDLSIHIAELIIGKTKGKKEPSPIKYAKQVLNNNKVGVEMNSNDDRLGYENSVVYTYGGDIDKIIGSVGLVAYCGDEPMFTYEYINDMIHLAIKVSKLEKEVLLKKIFEHVIKLLKRPKKRITKLSLENVEDKTKEVLNIKPTKRKVAEIRPKPISISGTTSLTSLFK